MSLPHQLLKQYFGYDEFRPLQLDIIETILAGQDCLALLPTGGGKSICFQIPGLTLPGLSVVISPLISLMEDQVFQLQKRGIPAALFTSAQSEVERNAIETQLQQGKLKFIYLSPEMLLSQRWLQLSQQLTISLVVIDEAHCISQWGHDFRPAYHNISQWLDHFFHRPRVAAFTATATTQVQKDITTSLGLHQPQVFQLAELPSHLQLNVWPCKDRFHKLMRLLQLVLHHKGQAGIIYASTRRAAEEVCQLLTGLDFHQQLGNVGYYHGGMEGTERSQIQTNFIANNIKLIVATNAFGMGVDKPDIRFVIHYQPSSSLEAYTQEVGRAGRDRKDASCHLLFFQPDLTINQELVADNAAKQRLLRQAVSFFISKRCLKCQLADYFSLPNAPKKCGGCSNCQSLPVLQTNLRAQTTTLLNWAQQVAPKHRTNSSHVLTVKTAALLALLKPTSQDEAVRIPGLGDGWVEKYWTEYQMVQYKS